jgi:drug/metabolite transporter (DMT)-like permease
MSKTSILTTVVVVSNVAGNLALSLGMKSQAILTAGAAASLAVFLSPLVLIGVLLLIVWVVSRMALMSWADLSYILPVTSIGYVLSAFAGKLFLAEQISGRRWAGTLLIVAGMSIVGLTQPKSGPSE